MAAPALLSPAAAAAAFGARAREACKEILELLCNEKDLYTLSDPPRLRAELFEKLPTRKMFPEYYRVIGHPIDIKSITACLRKGSTAWGGFKSCREFANAVELMAGRRSFTPG